MFDSQLNNFNNTNVHKIVINIQFNLCINLNDKQKQQYNGVSFHNVCTKCFKTRKTNFLEFFQLSKLN